MELKTEKLNEELGEGLVLVDFYATWCGPCKMMHPVIDQIEKENDGLKIIKIDIDQHEEIAREYGIMSIPTLLLFKNGKIVEKNVGFTQKANIDRWIEENR